jgi:hypothetical protein
MGATRDIPSTWAPWAVLAVGLGQVARPRPETRPVTVPFCFPISFFDFDSRNSYKLHKFIINTIRLEKIENKFLWNPLELLLAIGLTKSIFVHYGLIENSYKSNLGVFNYKNT